MDVALKPLSNKEEPEKDIWNAKELIERKITKLAQNFLPLRRRFRSHFST